MSAWRYVRYWLYVGHRWLGIVACLLFVSWFASGLVLSYVGYPEMNQQARTQALESIAWDRINIEPSQALAASRLASYPRELSLEMQLGEPVYRVVDWDGSRRTLSAVKIAGIEPITPRQAATIGAQYAHTPALSQTVVQRDQWTVPGRYTPFRPLHKISIDDADRTEVYVAQTTGEVVLATTRTQRFWNWLGAVPHWLYFTSLRANQPLWRQVNLWVSGPAILIALSGIWIGILRLRLQRRYAHGAASPYHGWKLWHHWAGIVGGLFLFSWILSGWLSVNPNQWLSGGSPEHEALLTYGGQPAAQFDVSLLAIKENLPADTRQLRFMHFDGRPLLLLIGADSSRHLLDAQTGNAVSISDEQIFASANALMPAHRVQDRQRLTTDDNYWYSHHEQRPLPVLRVLFDDAQHSAVYLDPTTGAVLDFVDAGARRNRWWFNALHRLDFRWLLQYRALWHAAIWLFSLAGLVISISGVVIGWRRLRRNAHGSYASSAPARIAPTKP
jgi:uncharacterized iron-regulated membrane protein